MDPWMSPGQHSHPVETIVAKTNADVKGKHRNWYFNCSCSCKNTNKNRSQIFKNESADNDGERKEKTMRQSNRKDSVDGVAWVI